MRENTFSAHQRADASWKIGSALEDIEGEQINMMTVISQLLQRLRQKDFKFKVSLSYRVSSGMGCDLNEILSQILKIIIKKMTEHVAQWLSICVACGRSQAQSLAL